MLSSAAAAAGDQPRPVRLPYRSLGALWAVYVTNQWSRALLAHTVSFPGDGQADPNSFINAALGFDEEAYAGLLAAVTTTYVLASLPAGFVADKTSRRVKVLAGVCVAWGIAMLMHALAPSLAVLTGARLLLGLAAACCSPLCNSLIADSCPPQRRGEAFSVYVSGVYVGAALATLSGSSAALLAPLGLPLRLGWRASYVGAGCASLLAAALALTLVREPPRELDLRARARAAPLGLRGALLPIRRVLASRTAALCLAAFSVRFVAGFSIQSWMPALCKARFPGMEGAFASVYAVTVLSGGLLGSLSGGLLSDVVSRRSSRPNAKVLVPMIGSAIAAPLFALAIAQHTLGGMMAAFFVHLVFAECWFGPTIATLLGSLPSDLRGTAQGMANFAQFFAGLAQAAIAPLARTYGIAAVVSAVVPLACLGSTLLFLAVYLTV